MRPGSTQSTQDPACGEAYLTMQDWVRQASGSTAPLQYSQWSGKVQVEAASGEQVGAGSQAAAGGVDRPILAAQVLCLR